MVDLRDFSPFRRKGGAVAGVACALLFAAYGQSGIADATPNNMQQLCDAQTWPRPVPEVVGHPLDQAYSGALACFRGTRGHAADGHNPLEHYSDYNVNPYRITAISPPSGSPVGANDPVTVEVVAVAPTEAPAFSPCSWVTAGEAAGVLGVASVDAQPRRDQPGSLDPQCVYDAGTQSVTADLKYPGSFPVDAQAQFDMTVAQSDGIDIAGTAMTGLPGPAYCTHTHGTGSSGDQLDVLLSGGRMYTALLAHDGQDNSCDKVSRFVQLAIPRMGA
jgi:hypothetical protein